jgi:DNA-binding NarL/FixJ family response regulator
MPAARRGIGVVVVDPLPVVREGIALLVADSGVGSALATAGSGEAAIEAIGRIRRNRIVVVVGLSLEGEHDASWTIAAIRDRAPQHAVLAMGANADPVTIGRGLWAGADGYVDKRVTPERFADAIVRAWRGEMVVEGTPDADVGNIASALDRRLVAGTWLTRRELQVLGAAAEGLTARRIGERLGMRERTVTTHLTRIYRKLGVSGRHAAIRSATRAGLVPSAVTE